MKHTPGPWKVGRLYIGRDQGNRSIPFTILTIEGPEYTDRFGKHATRMAKIDRLAPDLAADSEIMYYDPSPEAIADAEFIVTACNAHDDLLEACKAARAELQLLGHTLDKHGKSNSAITKVNSAIAKAGSKQGAG